MMMKLAKSKIFWFAAAYACILAVALVFALQATPEAEHHECTLDYIAHHKKTTAELGLMICEGNLTLNSSLYIFVQTDREIDNIKIEQFAQIGIIVYEDSWIPPFGNHPYHMYIFGCQLKDICTLLDVDYIQRIHAEGEGTDWLPEEGNGSLE